MLNRQIIKAEAIKFRTKIGLSSDNPIDTHRLLKQLNVITLFRKLSPNFSGMAVKINDLSFIMINSDHSIGRQNFTIFHEIYHLFIQDIFRSMACNTGNFDTKNVDEYKADWFAAYTLLPEAAILSRIPQNELSKDKISIATLLDLEQHFQCSRIALLKQLKELKFVSDKFIADHKINVLRYAKEYGYDTSLYKAGNEGLVIGDYGKKARTLFTKSIISESNYYSLMQEIGVDLDQKEEGNE